jgi:hypothetical protein
MAATFMFIALALIMNNWISRKKDLTLVECAPAQSKFEGGERIAVCGTIHPLSSEPLKSPFSQKDCVAYSYRVYSKHGEDEITEYSGCRLIPSIIRSGYREIKLLGWPNLMNFNQPLDTNKALDNAYRYLRSTSFKTYGVSNVKRAWADVKRLLTADDGSVRDDTRINTGTHWGAKDVDRLVVDLDERRFEEQYVPVGERVCLIGVWSVEKQGVESDGLKSGKELILIRGDQREAAAILQKQASRSLWGGVILGIVVNVMVYIALVNLP